MKNVGGIFLHWTEEEKLKWNIFVFFFRLRQTNEAVSSNFNTELLQFQPCLFIHKCDSVERKLF